MTIASQTSRISYNGDGSTTAFAVPFYFLNNLDLVVYLQDASGNQTLQLFGSNYTLSGIGDSSGGTCTFVSAPPSGNFVTIYRDPPVTQATSYNNNDPFPAKSHENALDKLTMLIQRDRDIASRAIRFPDGDPSSNASAILGSIATRKNKVLAFDNAGLPIYVLGPSFVTDNGVGVAEISSRATAEVTSFPGSVLIVIAEGGALYGVPEGGNFERVASQPSGLVNDRFRSADRYLPDGTVSSENGGWWGRINDYLAPATDAIAAPAIVNLKQRERHIGEWGVTFNYLNDGLVTTSAANTTRMQNALNSGERRIRVPGLVPIESELVMAHQCVLIGDQMRASGFVGVGMADNAATIRIQPLSTDSDEKNKRGWSVQEMAFLLHGGQNQGYVPIVVDTTGGIASRFLSNMHLGRLYIPEDHIPLGSAGGSPHLAILHQNDTPNGGMFVSRIIDSYFGAGIHLVESGDSIDIRHNTFTGYGIALEASLYTGAARLIFDRNNCTTRGGAVKLNGGEQAVITNNQIEQQAPDEGSYAAQIVLRGHLGAEIAQNNVSTLGFGTLDNIALLEGSEDNHIDRNTLTSHVFTGGRVHVRSDGSANNWIGAHNTTYDGIVPRTRSRIFVSPNISWRELHYDWLECELIGSGGPWLADDTSDSSGYSRGLFAKRVGGEVRLKGGIKPGTVTPGTQIASLFGDIFPSEARRISVTAIADGVISRATLTVNSLGTIGIAALPSFSTSLLLQFDGANYEL